MPPTTPADATSPEPPGRGTRLDSWKEIASHLRRDVRTVQRWQQRAGLPVHRHVDSKQRGVFAYTAELDAWASQSRLEAGTEPVARDELPGAATAPRRMTLTRGLVAAAFCAVAGLAAWSLWFRPPAPLPFEERDRLLVADFDNRTGDDVLEGTLQFVLERELAASTFVNVVPRLRVQDTLRLMRRPEDTHVTAAIAREVALRDGDIQAIVAGRVDRLGTGYLLNLEFIDPQTGGTIRTRTDEVASQSQLLNGVRRLADWVRGALGDPVRAPRSDERLPQVTTASLKALRYYAEAEHALSRNHRQASRVLLESAVREDPDFALAHWRLAMVLANEPDPRAARARDQHAARALALSDTVTEVERLRIVATHHMWSRQADEAIAAWEALLRLAPDDLDARGNLSGLYYRLRRIPEAVREAERLAELRPSDFSTAVAAAHGWVMWAGEPDRARPYVERARALWPTQQTGFSSEVGLANLPPHHARQAAWILLFPAYECWRSGDIKGMLAALQQVLESNPLPSPADRDALLTVAMALQMTAGRLSEARILAGRMSQERLRHLHFAVIADAIDDFRTLHEHMALVPAASELRALRYIRAGLLREAEDVLSRDKSNQGVSEVARGELARRRGQTGRAIEELRRGIELTRAHRLSERYLAAESLATVLEGANREGEALEVLEAATADEPRYALTGTSGAFWLRVLGRLSRTYREAGRLKDADAVDDRLRRLLAHADSDHPLLREMGRPRRQADSR